MQVAIVKQEGKDAQGVESDSGSKKLWIRFAWPHLVAPCAWLGGSHERVVHIYYKIPRIVHVHGKLSCLLR